MALLFDEHVANRRICFRTDGARALARLIALTADVADGLVDGTIVHGVATGPANVKMFEPAE